MGPMELRLKIQTLRSIQVEYFIPSTLSKRSAILYREKEEAEKMSSSKATGPFDVSILVVSQGENLSLSKH